MNMSKHNIVAAIGIVFILAASVLYSRSLSQTPQVSFVQVKRASVTQGVKVDGTVTAAQDLSLAFQQGGVVSQVLVKPGDSVKAGQVLVQLNAQDASAAANQAAASLASAKANYDKVINGATGADIDVAKAAVDTAQTALDNAKKNLTAVTNQQNQLVKNALSTLLNTGLAAAPSTNNISSVIPTITGAYGGVQQGQYFIKVYSSGTGWRFSVTGLETADGLVSSAPVALGTEGLYIQFSTTANMTSNDTWTINIPNTQSSNYLTNLNSYQAALQTQIQAVTAAQSAQDNAAAALTQAQATLTLKQTAARPEDIAAAQAQVEAAQAQVEAAQSALDKSRLTAPIDGVIASVGAKVGQTVTGSTIAPSPAAVKMLSAQKFQIDAYVSETDVAKIKVGDSASVTLDAYGSGVTFAASVISIDPGATEQSGISTYKTTLQFAQTDDRIKEGMSASVLISDQTHNNVLVVPQTAVIKQGSQTFVLTSAGGTKIQQTAVQTGITSVDGNVEILSGLSEGQQVAAFGSQQ